MKKNEMQLAAQLLDLNPAGALLLDARRKGLPVVCVNQTLAELTGYAAAEMIGQPWRHFSAGACAPVTETVKSHLREVQQSAPASRILSRNHQGSNDGVQLAFSPLYDDKDRLSGWYATIGDIPLTGVTTFNTSLSTEESSAAVRKRAGRDAATGLLNHDSFVAALRREWLQGSREQHELSAVVIRVDSFQEYLDVFGQHAGDACLRKVGAAITGCLRRSGDVSARFDTDSFIVLLAATSAANAQAVADRISEKVRGLALHHPRSRLARFVTVSCGVAGAMPNWEQPADELINEAKNSLGANSGGSMLRA